MAARIPSPDAFALDLARRTVAAAARRGLAYPYLLCPLPLVEGVAILTLALFANAVGSHGFALVTGVLGFGQVCFGVSTARTHVRDARAWDRVVASGHALRAEGERRRGLPKRVFEVVATLATGIGAATLWLDPALSGAAPGLACMCAWTGAAMLQGYLEAAGPVPVEA